MGRSASRVQPTGWPRLAAGLVMVAAVVIPSGVGLATTVGDTASRTVSLDTPGTVILDTFDPALGSLTSVTVSLRVDVQVQVCIENSGRDQASMVGGTATASLDAAFPGGASATAAAVNASGGPDDLAPSNGTDDCVAGFDETTGRFPAAVTATDTIYFENTDQATASQTLIDRTAMAPFTDSGTVAVTYTPGNDTQLALPTRWDNLAVARGQLHATVTYTYTPAGSGGLGLPFTGAPIAALAALAVLTLLTGTTAVAITRRHRTTSTPRPDTTGT